MNAPTDLSEDTVDVLATAADACARWREIGLERRLEVLKTAGSELHSRQAELHEGLVSDGLSRELAEHYGRTILWQARPELLEAYARNICRWADAADLDRSGNPQHHRELLVRRPDGVVLVVPPGNSPTLNSAIVFSVLLVGNAAIVRCPADSAGLRLIVESVIGSELERAGFFGLLRAISSPTRPFLDRFLPAPEVSTLVFFGNAAFGASVLARGTELGKKVVQELEGSDHMIVWRDADVGRASESARRAFDFSTQPCLVPKHFLVHEDAFDAFAKALLDWVPRCSSTVEADPQRGVLAPVSRVEDGERAFTELRGLGRVLTGGYRMNADGSRNSSGNYFAPTLVALDDTALASGLRCFEEEVSFPILPLVRFTGDDRAALRAMARVVEESPFGLRASLWTESPDVIGAFARTVSNTGLLILNGDHSQCPAYASPWGGTGRSGGPWGESHFFWEKTSHLQVISCTHLTAEQEQAVLEGLGCTRFVSSRKLRALDVTTSPDAVVELRIDDGVARIAFARPRVHNAIDERVVHELSSALDEIERMPHLRCVVLRGMGASFSSGADRRMLEHFDHRDARKFMLDATWTFRRLGRLPAIVLAGVDGYCLGGGFELALHCDLVIATERARFGFPEASLGLITTAGSIGRLLQTVGPFRAGTLLLSRETLSARRAHDWGLLDRVVADDDLDAGVLQRCHEICAMPTEGLRETKNVLRALRDPTDGQSWLAETEAFERLLEGRTRVEGKETS